MDISTLLAFLEVNVINPQLASEHVPDHNVVLSWNKSLHFQFDERQRLNDFFLLQEFALIFAINLVCYGLPLKLAHQAVLVQCRAWWQDLFKFFALFGLKIR